MKVMLWVLQDGRLWIALLGIPTTAVLLLLEIGQRRRSRAMLDEAERREAPAAAAADEP